MKIYYLLFLLLIPFVSAVAQYNNAPVATTGGGTNIYNINSTTYINQTIINGSANFTNVAFLNKTQTFIGVNNFSSIINTYSIDNGGEIRTDDLIFAGALLSNNGALLIDNIGQSLYFNGSSIIGGDISSPQLYVTNNSFIGIRTNNSKGCLDCSFIVGDDSQSGVVAGFRLSGTTYAKFSFVAEGGGADEKKYQMYTSGSAFAVGLLNDAENYEQYAYYFTRSGTTPTGMYLGSPITASSYSTNYYSGTSGCYDSSLGGQVCVDGGIVYSITDDPSDAKFKTNLTLLSLDTNKFKYLKPETWSWNISGKNGSASGLVAQELQSVYPELVKQGKSTKFLEIINITTLVNQTYQIKDKNNKIINKIELVNVTMPTAIFETINYSTIDYAGVIALQIKKIQELEERIVILEDKLK